MWLWHSTLQLMSLVGRFALRDCHIRRDRSTFNRARKNGKKKYTFAFINEEFVHSCIILLHKNRKLKLKIIFVLINIKKARRKLLYFLHLLITYVGLHASFNQKYWTFSLTHIILLIITLNTMDIPRWRCKTIFLHRE